MAKRRNGACVCIPVSSLNTPLCLSLSFSISSPLPFFVFVLLHVAAIAHYILPYSLPLPCSSLFHSLLPCSSNVLRSPAAFCCRPHNLSSHFFTVSLLLSPSQAYGLTQARQKHAPTPQQGVTQPYTAGHTSCGQTTQLQKSASGRLTKSTCQREETQSPVVGHCVASAAIIRILQPHHARRLRQWRRHRELLTLALLSPLLLLPPILLPLILNLCTLLLPSHPRPLHFHANTAVYGE